MKTAWGPRAPRYAHNPPFHRRNSGLYRTRFGFYWNDRKFNHYYYGVSTGEAGRSGLRKYTPGESVTPYAEISVNDTLTEHWDIYGGARYTLLPDDVKKSPVTEKDSLLSFWTGIAYTF